jgi:hypothetical protein
MGSIQMVMLRLFSKRPIILLAVLPLWQCDDADELTNPACEKDLRIAHVLPDRNPVIAPIMIVGKGFTNNTSASFNDVESEVNFINDTLITTRPPVELRGTVGLLELTVIDGVCSFTTGFTLTNGFEDLYRASPPVILFLDPGKKVFVSVKDTINKYPNSQSLWRNIWGGGHQIVFQSVSLENEFESEFMGTESIFYGVGTSLWTRFNKERLSLEIKIFYDQNYFSYGPMLADRLVGGFYNTTVATRNGLAPGTFLFLQSTVSGRQYIFEPITY